MFVISNAWRSVVRNKGRNILIVIIVAIIAVVVVVVVVVVGLDVDGFVMA